MCSMVVNFLFKHKILFLNKLLNKTSSITHIDTLAKYREFNEPGEPARSIKIVRKLLNERLKWRQGLQENNIAKGRFKEKQNIPGSDLLDRRFDFHKLELPKFNNMR